MLGSARGKIAFMSATRQKISAFVIAYNRAELIGTCLRALSFADEVIVVDKSSTDGTRAVATRHADKVVMVPWSPTVEETRAYALSLCQHDWILFLDDDECLSPEAARFISYEMENPRADIYSLPLRHYILGRHDEGAYYWPERHVRLFRRGAVDFRPTVHAGIALMSDNVMEVKPDTGVCIHHLSHPDVASWMERTNRYTSRPDRVRVEHTGADLVDFAHQRIDHWIGRSDEHSANDYTSAVALLRAVYDMVDRLKGWEEQYPAAGFGQVCAELDTAYRERGQHGTAE